MNLPVHFLSFIILFFYTATAASAATVPLIDSSSRSVHPVYKNIAAMKLKDFQKLVGRKLTFKEKITFLVFKYKTRHQRKAAGADGRASFILGFVGLLLLLIGFLSPAVWLGALAASILAIVTGSVADKKDNYNREAHIGKMLGWITLGALALLLILAVIFIASVNR